LRTLGEIETLRKKGKFILLAVDAEPKIRYQRVSVRGTSTDNVSFEKFLADEAKEMTSTDPNKQNLKKCIEMADFIIEKKYDRPSWDDYFMEVMEAISKRATCDRGRSGCVIVKDKQILVTGYVGSPKGLPHCDEVGHQFKKMINEDGSISEHCVRTVHAEQNAICQAAKRGIAIDGATLYCRMTRVGLVPC
jgi:deoxycytidylate deaminase